MPIYQAIWSHVPEDSNLDSHRRENPKSRVIITIPPIEESVYDMTQYFIFYL
jgi:hypothetical protein